jgi:DNA-binding NarL/FixJ family response regulator
MKHQKDIVSVPTTHGSMFISSDRLTHSGAKITETQTSKFDTPFHVLPTKAVPSDPERLRVAWVDIYRLTRECIMKAFIEVQPALAMMPYATAEECIADAPPGLDLIIYHSHALDTSSLQSIAALHHAFSAVPLIFLSDSDDAHQIRTIRETLKSGAHGFISTRTTGISMAFAALRFVKAGGTIAPLDLLLTERPVRVIEPEAAPSDRLTLRQMAVLAHLQQGKANKIIAHELGMSESTVKVHVRNIMRKMGATNRTQAAFKARTNPSGREIRVTATD